MWDSPFNNRIVRDPMQKLNGWSQYFSNLYSSPLETDCDFDKTVNDTISNISTSASFAFDDDQLSTPFFLSDLNKVNLPRRKASGIDNISYQHIISYLLKTNFDE